MGRFCGYDGRIDGVRLKDINNSIQACHGSICSDAKAVLSIFNACVSTCVSTIMSKRPVLRSCSQGGGWCFGAREVARTGARTGARQERTGASQMLYLCPLGARMAQGAGNLPGIWHPKLQKRRGG